MNHVKAMACCHRGLEGTTDCLNTCPGSSNVLRPREMTPHTSAHTFGLPHRTEKHSGDQFCSLRF
ncbi:hypothetical protein E2C01_080657 [Portunus trituberculatus]|uniref:Uncharacterized protein n=1 Tax=Portunus trituberculatus TaxID=210409 RepID=A0A5B7IUM9_PORTR|nr:hypothetical protein [Portunus trituberculatus]